MGLFATWGSFHPARPHLSQHPLVSARLDCRVEASSLVDFPLAVSWAGGSSTSERAPDSRAGLGRRSRWVSAAPALVIVVALRSRSRVGSVASEQNPYLQAATRQSRRGPSNLSNVLHLLIALVAALAILFLATHSKQTLCGVDGGTGRGPGGLSSLHLHRPHRRSRSSRSVGARTAQQLLGTNGRFALVDAAGAHTGIYRQLGEPNMNVFTHLASVQGYGSLISNLYDDATGTHPSGVPQRLSPRRGHVHSTTAELDRHLLLPSS